MSAIIGDYIFQPVKIEVLIYADHVILITDFEIKMQTYGYMDRINRIIQNGN